jgi:hypothetical protein
MKLEYELWIERDVPCFWQIYCLRVCLKGLKNIKEHATSTVKDPPSAGDRYSEVSNMFIPVLWKCKELGVTCSEPFQSVCFLKICCNNVLQLTPLLH